MKIIGGDFNAELGRGEGLELSAVGHYTLNKVNCRGEWMTQWLLENKLVALNTMYKKSPPKQVTCRTPKEIGKQLDYILTDRKHYQWSRDAKASDTIHMGSDHRCVMARFEIPRKKEKGKPRKTKAPVTEQHSETCDDEKQQKYLELEQEVKEAEPGKNTKKAAGEMKEAGVEAMSQEAKAEEVEGKIATDASEAPAAAADEGINQRHAAASEGTAASGAQERNEKDERIRALVQERKTTAKHNRDRIREISKEIKKYIRENKRLKRQEKIQKILEKVKGTKNISSIKSMKNVFSFPKSRTRKAKSSRRDKEFPTFFAKFYEDLYEGEEDYTGGDVMMETEGDDKELDQTDCIKEFTTDEIQNAIDRLKKGKAKDNNGIRAEQLKICSDETKEEIRTIFNEIAQQEDFTPKSWRKIRIQVIYKKGNREDAGNYMPICGLPILYKLFATVGTLCSTRPRPAQNTTPRPGGVSAKPQMRGSPHGVQGAGAMLSRVGCTTVHQYDRLYKSI